jgi:hypothetical protein
MPYNTIIVGMPRSGTSMTAAIFARAGYFVTADPENQLYKSDEFNPTGYWEAEPLIQANAEVFQAVGFPRDNTWLYEPIPHAKALAISEIKRDPKHLQLLEAFNRHRPWMWKDPRLCYTLGYWWPLMDPATTRVLLLKRDPQEIHRSFLRLKMCSPSAQDRAELFQRVEDHIKAAEYAIEKYNIPHIVVHYSDYARDADATASRISEFFDLSLQVEDLGFDKRANGSSLRGKIAFHLDRIADRMPDRMRKSIKRVIPASLLHLVFPFKA